MLRFVATGDGTKRRNYCGTQAAESGGNGRFERAGCAGGFFHSATCCKKATDNVLWEYFALVALVNSHVLSPPLVECNRHKRSL